MSAFARRIRSVSPSIGAASRMGVTRLSLVTLLLVVAAGCSSDDRGSTAKDGDLYTESSSGMLAACPDSFETPLDDGRLTLFSSSCSFALVQLADGGIRIGWIAGIEAQPSGRSDAFEAIGETTGCFGPTEIERMELARPGDAQVTEGRTTWGFEPGDDNPNTASLVIICSPA